MARPKLLDEERYAASLDQIAYGSHPARVQRPGTSTGFGAYNDPLGRKMAGEFNGAKERLEHDDTGALDPDKLG